MGSVDTIHDNVSVVGHSTKNKGAVRLQNFKERIVVFYFFNPVVTENAAPFIQSSV